MVRKLNAPTPQGCDAHRDTGEQAAEVTHCHSTPSSQAGHKSQNTGDMRID